MDKFIIKGSFSDAIRQITPAEAFKEICKHQDEKMKTKAFWFFITYGLQTDRYEVPSNKAIVDAANALRDEFVKAGVTMNEDMNQIFNIFTDAYMIELTPEVFSFDLTKVNHDAYMSMYARYGFNDDMLSFYRGYNRPNVAAQYAED